MSKTAQKQEETTYGLLQYRVRRLSKFEATRPFIPAHTLACPSLALDRPGNFDVMSYVTRLIPVREVGELV